MKANRTTLEECDVFLFSSAKIGSNRQPAESFLVYLFCMLDSTSCITYVEMLRECKASIEL